MFLCLILVFTWSSYVFSYWTSNGPKDVELKGLAARNGLKIFFKSDSENEGTGAICTAVCLDITPLG